MIVQDLFEMPISGIHTYGDMSKPGSFRVDDLRMVSSPQAHEKIVRVLRKAPVDIELHFVNLPYPVNANYHFSDKVGIGILNPEKFNTRYGFKLKLNKNALNLAYVENEGTDRVRMTPWIIAHRLSHIFAISTVLEDEWHTMWDKLRQVMRHISWRFHLPSGRTVDVDLLAYAFGTTSICREGRLTQPAEWFHECFAQFCVTGEVRFNSASNVSMRINVGKMWPSEVKMDVNDISFFDNKLKNLSVYLMSEFSKLLTQGVGKLLVL